MYVEVGDVEDLMLVHEGLGVGSWWSVHDDSDDLFLNFDDWVEVRHERCVGDGLGKFGRVGGCIG